MSTEPMDTEATLPVLDPRSEGLQRRRTPGTTPRRGLGGTVAAFTSLAAAVLAFAGAWTRGDAVIDGPGVAMYVRLALDHLTASGRVSYWLPEIWAGTPAWAVAPSLQVFAIVPFAAVFGPTAGTKVVTLGLQVLGAWGTFVLARSLWRNTPAALVAGVVYGLSPLVISLAALTGAESAMGVVAATPWLVWSLRKGLRGDGTRYVVGAGMISAFAVLHQAEYAYGLALLCVCLLAMEVGRARRGLTTVSAGRILARASLVVAVALGLIAYWLLPFVALGQSFILSPPALLHSELATGIANIVGRDLGLFLHRSGELHGAVSSNRPGLITHVLYLGWVPAAMTMVSAAIISRRSDDGTLSAILVASTIALWMSTGSVSLAEGGPVARHQVLPLLVIGVLAGLVFGGFVRRAGPTRAVRPTLALVAVFLFVAPYVAPFVVLRNIIPLLGSIRFPRFYVVAVLGLALGTAWPVTRAAQWVPAQRRRLAVAAPGLLAIIIVGAVVADSWPYQSFYRLRNPADSAAYRDASAQIAARPAGSRVIPNTFDSRTSASLLRAGADLSLAWPHPLAGTQVWRLTEEALLAPTGFSNGALGLSSTAYTAGENLENAGTGAEAVSSVELVANPRNLPVVRAYDRVMVVDDRSITPELSVALAYRHIGVVAGGASVARELTAMVSSPVVPAPACDGRSTTRLPDALAGEVGLACGLHRWLSTTAVGWRPLGGGSPPGSTFTAIADGLKGMSVWLYDPSGHAQLVLHELGGDGRTVGPEIARVGGSGIDEYGMTLFKFDPVAGSAGRRYLFDIECPDCYQELAPQIIAVQAYEGNGDLLLGRQRDPDHEAAFAPVYEQVAAEAPSTTKVVGHRLGPGSWRVETTGSRPALVVVAEADFPGWQARVDGRSVPVLEADGAFLGVPVAAGNHKVTLEYHAPTAATLGRLITAATLLAIVVAGLWSRRKRTRDKRAPIGSGASTVTPADT